MASIAAFSGSVPANYDKYLGPVLFEIYALDLVDRLKKDKVKNILEIACGTGRLTKHLLEVIADDGTITATDLNPDMIEIAKSKIQNDKIIWQVADGQELPFDDNFFDHVVCQYGVMFFPDKEKGFSEAYRVLQPGGKYIFNTWDSIEFNPRTNLIKKVMDEAFGQDAPTFLTKGPYSFFNKNEINELMQNAGFKNIKIDVVQKTSQSNIDDFTKGFLEGSPLGASLSEKDDAIKRDLGKKIKEEMDKEFGRSSLVQMQALVCEGSK